MIFLLGKKHAPNYTNDDYGNAIGTIGKCETCGNTLDEQNMKLKKDKRFCSSVCAKRFVIFINNFC